MNDRGILDRLPPPPGQLTAYGPAPHQVFEVFGEPHRRWVFLLHGGFWRAKWDRAHLRPLAAALGEAGYAVALIEYGRSGMPGGGWPGTFEDVAAALSAVREHAEAAQTVQHDEGRDQGEGRAHEPVRIALAGHSAGGHLAAWLLHRHEAAGVTGAISLAGCLDLTMAAELDLDEGAAVDLMGGPPAEHPDRYAAADPTRLGASPYPLVVVHGTADERVPLDLSRSWWDRNATPGQDRLEVLEGVSHFPLIDPEATFFPRLTALLDGLLGAR